MPVTDDAGPPTAELAILWLLELLVAVVAVFVVIGVACFCRWSTNRNSGDVDVSG